MAVTRISLATTSVRNDREGNKQERTEWHRVVFFGKLGEIAGASLRKGSQVYVEGEIRYDKYTDRTAWRSTRPISSPTRCRCSAAVVMVAAAVAAITSAATVPGAGSGRIHYLAMDEFAGTRAIATPRWSSIRSAVRCYGSAMAVPARPRAPSSSNFPPALPSRSGRAIDMTTAYELEIKANCPNAEVVYDLFHVVAKYGREVIDRVRVDQANQLRHDKPARRVIKSSRWLRCAIARTWIGTSQ